MSRKDQAVWLITGGAGALGAALGEQLASRGDEVVLLDKNRRGLESTHDRIQTTHGVAPALYPMDLAGASANDYETLLESLADAFGRLNGIVHAAAETPALKPLEHLEPAAWFGALQCGITGPYLLTRALMPLMRQTGHGQVVWVLDAPQDRQKAFWGAHGVSQAARQALVNIWAEELGPRDPEILSWTPAPFRSSLRGAGQPAEDPGSLPGPEIAASALLEWLSSKDVSQPEAVLPAGTPDKPSR